MTLSVDAMQRFCAAVSQLQTFPLFIGYLVMIPLTGVWQKSTRPLNLRWVIIKVQLTVIKSFLRPPVQTARWAHMHSFLSVCPSICLCVCD